jgi:peroxiredoxin Q/BCP
MLVERLGRRAAGMRGLIAAALLLACSCGGAQRAGTLLAVGDVAPDFMAMDQEGRVRELRSLARRRPVVLFFYPRDGTPGCTREACAFRDAWDRLQASGAVVIGVSTDDVESHRRFAEEHELPFPLLADPDGAILRRYGVPTALGMAARVTYVIGEDGRVRRVFPDVDPAVHVDQVLGALAP